jgi:hypothetical protein
MPGYAVSVILCKHCSVSRFARLTVTTCAPLGPERAKALLFACGKLGAFASAAGLELDPQVCLHPSVTGRFIRTAGRDLSAPARRTLRTNLAEAALDGVAFLVPAGVEDGQAACGTAAVTAMFLLVFLDGNDGRDVVAPQPGTAGCGGVGLAGHRAAGSSTRRRCHSSSDRSWRLSRSSTVLIYTIRPRRPTGHALVEKLGRNDPWPCGSGRRFPPVLP